MKTAVALFLACLNVAQAQEVPKPTAADVHKLVDGMKKQHLGWTASYNGSDYTYKVIYSPEVKTKKKRHRKTQEAYVAIWIRPAGETDNSHLETVTDRNLDGEVDAGNVGRGKEKLFVREINEGPQWEPHWQQRYNEAVAAILLLQSR